MKKDSIKDEILKHKIFNSFIKTSKVTRKEIILGYLIGPFGAFILNSTLASYLNLFYTDVLGLVGKEYKSFLALFPIISTVIIVFANLLTGIIIDKTRTVQGKARPYLLLAAPLMALSYFLMFVVPSGSIHIKIIWVVVSYNLYYSVAYAIYSMAHGLMVPLSTRNTKTRSGLSIMSSSAGMIATAFAFIVFPMVVLPYVGVNQTKWITIMGIMSACSLVIILFEYYFTFERITKEATTYNIVEQKLPIKKQLKAITADKYWWIIIFFGLIYQSGACIRSNSMVYYCNYVLGTYNDGRTQTLLSLVGGLPIAIGGFCIWPLTKKFNKRNIIITGLVLSVIGGFLCWLSPSNLTIVIIGQIIKAFGGIPVVYIMAALVADVLDHLECKNGLRCDGLTMSFFSSIAVAMYGVCIGLFNLLLHKAVYIAPITSGDAVLAATQNNTIIDIITFGFIGAETVGHFLLIGLLIFLKVEKHILQEQSIILNRQKEAVIASGGVWIEPAERERLEQEKY